MIERDAVGVLELDNIGAAIGVAAIKRGGARGEAGVVVAFDADSLRRGAENEIRAQIVSSRIDANRVAGVEIISRQDGADRRFGGRDAEAVVGVVAGGRRPIAGLNAG